MSENYITVDTHFYAQSGFAFPSTAFEDSGIPIVRMSDLKDGQLKFENTKYVSEKWLNLAHDYLLNENDFLLGMSGSLSNYAVVSKDKIPALLNQRVARLKQKNNSHSYEYVSYWLKSNFYHHYADIQGEGAAQKNISSKQIGLFKYRNALKEEQLVIVNILRTIDQAIEKTEALIEKYQQIKAGLMHDLFTRGICADGKLRPPREQAPELYQQTPIGWIPKEWNFSNLGKMYREPARNGLYKPAHFHGSGLPMIQMGNMFKGMYVSFESVGRVFVTDSELKTFGLLKGDLLFGRRSLVLEGAGKCALVEDIKEPSTFESSIIRVRLKQDLIQSLFASYFFSSEIAYLNRRKFIRQVAVSGISGEDLKSFTIPMPQLEEQSEISNRLLCIDSSLDITNKNLQKLYMQKSGLMNDLLTGKVQVPINSDEASNV